MSLRERVREAVCSGRLDELESIISKESKSVRYLVGLMYELDEDVRKTGAAGIAIAARHHPRMVKNVIQRLVWAMSNDSGAYVPTAPEVLKAIADEQAELLVPVVSDLVRLAGDTSLSEGICDTLRAVASQCPGIVGRSLTETLNKRLLEGEHCGIGIDR